MSVKFYKIIMDLSINDNIDKIKNNLKKLLLSILLGFNKE